MSSLNRACLIGNLGKDPETRNLQNGNSVVSFSLATSESWRDKQTGDRKEKTEWHNVVIFNEGIGRVVEQYCKKGSKIYVEGAIKTRKWQDKDGNDKYTTEIVVENFGGKLVLLSAKGEGGGRDDDGEDRRERSSSRSTGGGKPPIDDDIPFGPEWRG
jgi:single-strand DNA-binding protein